METILVFDVGGSHLSAAAFSPSTRTIAGSIRADLAGQTSAETFTAWMAGIGRSLLPGGSAVSGLAIAVPGPFDYADGVSFVRHKLEYLFGYNLKRRLAGLFRLPEVAIHFLDDAEAFLFGEVGTSATVPDGTIGITLGTGIGSAAARGRRILRLGEGEPPWQKLWDRPFRQGMVEDALSTRRMESEYLRAGGDAVRVREMAARIPGDRRAESAFRAFGRDLGEVLRMYAVPYAPCEVVLGGGMTGAAEHFLPIAIETVHCPGMNFRLSTLGDEAALVGAGLSWLLTRTAESAD